MTEETNKTPTPPPRLKLGQLNSLRGVRRALTKVTNAMLAGQLPVKTANCAIYALSTMTKVLEVEIFEQRLEALEEQAQVMRPGHTGASGSARH